MFEKFKSGLAFGAGFGISFVIVFYLFSFGFTALWSLGYTGSTMAAIGEQGGSTSSRLLTEDEIAALDLDDTQGSFSGFHELPIDDQIKAADFIAVASFEETEDGRRAAIIKEMLKQEDGQFSRYEVGDEWHEPGMEEWADEVEDILVVKGDAIPGLTAAIRDGKIPLWGGVSLEMVQAICEDDS